LDNSGLSEPGAAVNFTYPSINGQEGIDINPTLTWDPVSDGDALAMWLWDPVTYDDVCENVPVSISETSWVIPVPLQHNHSYDLDVSVINVKDWIGPALPTKTVGVDTFEYCIPGEGYAIGYSLDEGDWIYFYSFQQPVWSYNIATGLWTEDRPVGLIYADWPFYYMLDTGSLMFTLPPEGGLWVYHFSTGQWTVLPRILP